jgi:hypothetical protein
MYQESSAFYHNEANIRQSRPSDQFSYTGTTRYSLVFEMEAVMPLKVEISSLKVLVESELKEAEWTKMKYEQLNMISDKRLAAICHH